MSGRPPILLLALAALAVVPSSVTAVTGTDTFLTVSGTSTGPSGRLRITIVDVYVGYSRALSPQATRDIDIPIPTGFTASASASAIRDSLFDRLVVNLPLAGYSVTMVGSDGVRFQNVNSFTTTQTQVEPITGQTYFLFVAGGGGASMAGWLALLAMSALIGGYAVPRLLTRRR